MKLSKTSVEWLGLACVLGACQLAACGSESSEEACFPVPRGVAVARTGMENQGTSLQGASPEEEIQGMTMQGTSLQGATPGEDLQGMSMQGTSLQGGGQRRGYRGLADLNGARLRLADGGAAVTLRDGELRAPGFEETAALAGVELEATAPDGRTFRVEVVGATLDGRTQLVDLAVDGLPVCEPGQSGVIVRGRWDDSAAHVDDQDVVTYSCASGVIAKCVAWGYAPWLVGADLHAACTRLARADYCGDGTSWTLDGTHIGVFDTLGVQARVATGTMEFEAAWSRDGAVCVTRTRYELYDESGARLEPGCFATMPRCASLDEPAAASSVLANDSYVTPITACE